MSSLNLRGSHLSLIARAQMRFSIRGGAGVIFLVIGLLVGLMSAGIYISFIEEIKHKEEVQKFEAESSIQTEELLDLFVKEYGHKVVHWMVKKEPESEDLARHLVERPAIVSAFLLTFLMFVPFLVALSAFNQTAGDIGNRGLRYQLLRTERANIFLGRFLGTYIFTAIVILLLMVVLVLYLVLKFRMYPAAEVTSWMAWGTLTVLLYALPYVAICAWVSSLFGSSFGALAVCYTLIGVVPLVLTIAERQDPVIGYAWYLIPWGYKYWLVHPNPLYWGLGIVAMLGLTGAFLFFGLFNFHNRDL